MTKVEVLDLTAICQSFPETPEPSILRDNLLDTIDTIFWGGIELVAVEGVDGIGKTILLTQFARKHPNHALSLFIRPTSRWAYDPGLLRKDLCNQLNWVLHNEELLNGEVPEDAVLRDLLSRLLRRARRKGELFYFLVDGLHDIPKEDKQVRDLVLDMLPLGLPGFRFLIAGELEEIPADIQSMFVTSLSLYLDSHWTRPEDTLGISRLTGSLLAKSTAHAGASLAT